MRSLNVYATYVRPPIPTRELDYEAYDEETLDEDSPIGRGPTADAAIADLAAHPSLDDWTAEELIAVELTSLNHPNNLAFIRHYREIYKDHL